METGKGIRRQQAEETKRHIFHTALRLLDERGFEAIKVRDIVEAANVSVGTFYHYYTTKLDVFYETYQIADEYFDQQVRPILTQAAARERLRVFFDEYAKYSSEITGLSLTKVLYNSNNHCFNRSADRGMLQVLLEQVRLGVDEGAFSAGESPEDIAQFMIVAARGLVYHWCTRDGDYPLRPAMARYVSRLLDACR